MPQNWNEIGNQVNRTERIGHHTRGRGLAYHGVRGSRGASHSARVSRLMPRAHSLNLASIRILPLLDWHHVTASAHCEVGRRRIVITLPLGHGICRAMSATTIKLDQFNVV